jgi:hypothetical protein
MFSADLMVDDTIGVADRLVERLGLPALRQTWTDVGRTLEELIYLRAYHPLSAAAPTNIEIVNGGLYPKMGIRPGAWGRQAEGRPIQTHATVLISKRYGEVMERIREAGLRVYEMPDPGDGLARCWFGVEHLSSDDPVKNDYDPTSDGHLFLELISWEGTTLAARDPIPVNVHEGGTTRVVARTYLVPDIDSTLGALRRALDWPGPEVSVSEGSGLRHAYLQPSMPESAALELVQPTSEDNRHGAFFARWGVGPHAIRIGVNGLAAKAEDLRRRGTPFTDADTPAGEPVLVVDGEVLGGPIVELVEDAAFAVQ